MIKINKMGRGLMKKKMTTFMYVLQAENVICAQFNISSRVKLFNKPSSQVGNR